MEIERKFVLPAPPADLDRHPSSRIRQGYLAIGDDGTETRVRSRDGAASLTVKQGSGRSRDEVEIALDADVFERLWPLTGGRRVEKTRHVVPGDAGAVIEVDVYDGDHTGLVTAEVEFGSEADADAFLPPAWLGSEVTADPRFKNQRLALDGVPAGAERTFRLDGDEDAAEGIRRIVRGQIDGALDDLRTPDDLGEGIHSARKAFKRARAALRLVRDELGDETYRRENAMFRDAGRRLAGARDAKVLVETLDALAERFRDEVPEPGVRRLRAALAGEHEAESARMRDDESAVREAVAELEAARDRVHGWPLPAGASYAALAPGFRRIYRRARRAHRAALEDTNVETLHELRKRTKDVWHAAQIARPVAPKPMKRLARSAHKLAGLIGDDHDLAVLRDAAAARHELFGPGELARLEALIARRQDRLRRKALKRAKRLYARKPRNVARRFA